MRSRLLSFCIPRATAPVSPRQLLTSIAAQSTPEIEVVISDDGSTDDTAAVVESFRDRPSAVGLRAGRSRHCATTGISCTPSPGAGEYCWLFGDDDRLEPGALAAVLARAAEPTPDLTGLTTDRISYDSALDRPNSRSRP